jgi:hypothetical protein
MKSRDVGSRARHIRKNETKTTTELSGEAVMNTTNQEHKHKHGALRRLAVWALVCGCWISLAPVAAQAAPAKEKAKKHFKQGEVYYQQGMFREALKEYRKAHRLIQHPAFIFNMAQCHRQLGEYRKALFSYKLFLSENPKTPNRKEVLGRIREMKKKVAQNERAQKNMGRVSVVTAPAGAEILVDGFKGTPVATSPSVLKLAAGSHLIVARKKGHKTVNKTVKVKSGQLLSLNLTLPASTTIPRPRQPDVRQPDARQPDARQPDARQPDARQPDARQPDARQPDGHKDPGATTTSTSSTDSTQTTPATPTTTVSTTLDTQPKPFYKTWWFWTGAAGAVALGAGAAATGALTMSYRSKWKKDYNESDRDTGKTLRLTTDILLGTAVLAAAGVTVGVLVVYFGNKKKKEKQAFVTPSCTAHGCGLVAAGRF